jgi:hypothetical protein
MNKQVLIRYAELKIEASKIDTELELLKEQALSEIVALRDGADSPVQLAEFPGYSFTTKFYRKWQYTVGTQNIEKSLKAKQKEEQQTGLAEIIEEKLSLVFNSPKSYERS